MEEMMKIYRLMCFNVVIGNRDDHARNFAFIYDNGWRFAPAYDLLPCGTAVDFHTTSVNDNPLPQREDCLRLADKVGLDMKRAVLVYDEVEKSVIGQVTSIKNPLPGSVILLDGVEYTNH